MGFQISNTDVEAVINCVPDAIERVLKVVQVKVDRFVEKGPRGGSPMGGGKGSPQYGNQYNPNQNPNQYSNQQNQGGYNNNKQQSNNE